MSRDQEPYTCDVCGKKRETDANRWWLVWLEQQPWAVILVVSPWNDKAAEADNIKHTCGQACCQSLAERWLTTGSLDEVKKGGTK